MLATYYGDWCGLGRKKSEGFAAGRNSVFRMERNAVLAASKKKYRENKQLISVEYSMNSRTFQTTAAVGKGRKGVRS